MLWIILAIIISYLIGSIPTAYIFGRVLKGIDIRKHGSGNVGATNALRVLGKGPGILVLLLDVLKGLLPVVYLGNYILSKTSINSEFIYIGIGLFCICGHNWTVFLNFKGGKGIATTLGVLIGLSVHIVALRVIILMVVGVWVVVFILTRKVSLGSLIAAFCFPIFMLAFKQSLFLIIVSFLLSIFIFIRHKSNISRLIQGKESSLSFKSKK